MLLVQGWFSNSVHAVIFVHQLQTEDWYIVFKSMSVTHKQWTKWEYYIDGREVWLVIVKADSHTR